MELAKELGADAVAHGCTGKGNDQVRFELAAKALAPELQIIAPWREWNIVSREEAIAYAQAHNVPVEQTTKNIYSRDRNIWHLSHEGGVLEDPANAPDEAMWQWIISPAKAPAQPTTVEIGFEGGTPVSVNGKKLAPVALLEQLNEIAAANGVGRMDIVENRLVGIKSRGAYETPGGTLLVTAHRELESLALDRETAHYQQILSLRYAEMVYYGMWFTPLRESLDAFFTSAQRRVTGSVSLTLCKGNRERRVAEFAVFAVSHESRELHDDRLQPQGRRRLHQSFRAADHRAARTGRCRTRKTASEGQRLMTAPREQKMWGGRFERGPDASFYEFERSWSFDRRMLPQELALDRAWARAIVTAGILTEEEGQKISTALGEIALRAQTDTAWLDSFEGGRRSPFR